MAKTGGRRMSYVPPVEISFEKEISKKITADFDGAVTREIQREYKLNVDKDELIRALQYDRGQYDKGYQDGYKAGYEKGKQKHGHWIKEKHERPICSVCGSEGFLSIVDSITGDFPYCTWCGAKMDEEAEE